MSMAHGFGQRLEALRQYRGYSQDALTLELGLAPGTVARWECERELPERSQLLKLSACLRVAVDEIVGVPDSLDTSTVHSLALHRFLGTTVGQHAQRRKLEQALQGLPSDLTAEEYAQLTSWLHALLEPEGGPQ